MGSSPQRPRGARDPARRMDDCAAHLVDRVLPVGAVNLGSPEQLAELLFDKLGLPPGKKTKTGYSTDAEVLEELSPLHPAIDKILDHRAIIKLKGTYLAALPQLIDTRTGRTPFASFMRADQLSPPRAFQPTTRRQLP